MRKLTLELEPNEMTRKVQKPIFEKIQSYEVLEVLRLDYEDGVTIGVMECNTKSGIPLQDVKVPDLMEILNILKSEGNTHTCIVKIQNPKEFMHHYIEFKMELIWTTPMVFSEDKRTYSCIGDQQSISKFVELMKNYGEVVNLSFQKAAYQKHDILSVLTEKQREVLVAAKKHGYYTYPRKIKSEELAQKIGISKGTALEHLRKAEERLMENILAGY
ncbi:MAG: helix-turn-helix domain-containing protein [Thermoplasmata archaeon]|nr:MAG: helix-turn-helix domain-containing protein [Thermoplasmata archaeon]